MTELTLAIEASNPSSGGIPGVALGMTEDSAVKLVDVEPLGTGERHDDLLMPAIDRLLKRTGHKPADLDRIVCSRGPGGYTGLRIATAAANIIALTAQARLFGVPSAWVAAAQVESESPFAVALASKGQTSFLTLFDPNGGPRNEGEIIGPSDLERLEISLLIADRFLPEAIANRCEELAIEVRPPQFRAEACLALSGLAVECEVGNLVPCYGREAEAVTKWRQLHPKKGD